MDLRTGIYFSADGLAAMIWDGIASGHGTAAIEARIQAATNGDAARIARDVAVFVAALVENKLVQEGRDGAPPADWSLALPAAPIAYAAPVLERHGDLQDLAALDPIHDVEQETGWPNRRLAD